MLQEAKDLQMQAVKDLTQAVNTKDVLTFRAPTGSGKTRMMADFMNRILEANPNVVFLVSTLSKGGLAEQNYDTFLDCATRRIFPNLRPYLINTETGGEGALFIPTDYNVYVLPRDLSKKNGKLQVQGAMPNFLLTMTESYFGKGLNKRIWLIKDEAHQATNNLDLYSRFFVKTINFSATPNLKRKQAPDVQITDDDAVKACLIKQLEVCDDYPVPVEAAIDKLLAIRSDYIRLLNTNPCLIIQISNENKANIEWEQTIKPAIDKHQNLKWMYIVGNKALCDTNDDVKRRLPVERWRDYAKEPLSTIDIIIFKMTISEGWDIPRACMLCQVRESASEQLDEQVIGRVRRNPRLLDYENLSPKAQELAMKAWIWGTKSKAESVRREVTLWSPDGVDISAQIKVKTTRLIGLKEDKDFCVAEFVDAQRPQMTDTDIFTLWRRLEKSPSPVQDLCYEYAQGNSMRWRRFAEATNEVSKRYNAYICDYDRSIRVNEEEVSFPVSTSYTDTAQKTEIDTWVWRHNGDNSDIFAFDSVAECLWAEVLKECKDYMAVVEGEKAATGAPHFLWGKNFPVHSELKYQYYANGFHDSYPDFVMKDKRGRIHIFEVKSANISHDKIINEAEYEAKVAALKDFYLHCSGILSGYIFYIPILDKDNYWQIFYYVGGKGSKFDKTQFMRSLQ